MLVPFQDPNSYALKDKIKQLCPEAHFDKENRVWMVAKACLPELTRLSEDLISENKEKSKHVWKKACEQFNLSFVKKGTPEYDKVLQVFKELIKKDVDLD